ncbi:MAG: hypothetical protein O7C75_15685 [Verrucomicrobia bacterium]|nr:hypothetical protein [Verrucomicrobiota bacterium]
MKLPTKTLAIVVTTALFASFLNAANKVSIRAEATEEYVDARAFDGTKKIQTYQFMKGRYFPGDVKRITLENFAFMDVLKDMAVHLQKQNFQPNLEYGEGDLVLVVHYGVTHHQNDYPELWGYTPLQEMGFLAFANEKFNKDPIRWYKNKNLWSTQFKARLLGMEEAYDWKHQFSDYDLSLMIDEPRYFVVLMAYDLPLAKQGTLKLHWITRYSIRATGQPYDRAIKYMNEIAGDFFGKNLDRLNKKFPADDSKVEIGEIEVLEFEPKVLDYSYFERNLN